MTKELIQLAQKHGGYAWRADGCQKIAIPEAQWEAFAAAISAQARASEAEDALSDHALHLIAECRNAFPVPPPGSPLEEAWMLAINDPENVPDYMRAIAATQGDAGSRGET